MSMATDARIGSELAGYRIEAPIGRGGMGVVYRAEQLRLGRKVALKLLAPELAENQGFRARFEHESRLAAALDHPNIVPLFEAGEADGLLFISMRYVEGTDLRALLSLRGGSSPSARWRSPARWPARSTPRTPAASSTATSSRRTSSSPGDVAPDLPEHCYLTDFGLTKDTSSPVELTATGTFVGTIDYIAPEQIEGAKPDGRGDQYALACVLFECLTGHPPFPRDEEISVMWAHLQDEPPSVTAARPELPAAHRRGHRAGDGQGPQGALRDVHGDGRRRPRRAAAEARSRPLRARRARTASRPRRRARPASTRPTPLRRRPLRRPAGSAAAAPALAAPPLAAPATAAGAEPAPAAADPRARAAPLPPRTAGASSRSSAGSWCSSPSRATSPVRAAATPRPRPARWRATTTSRWPTTRAGRPAASRMPSAASRSSIRSPCSRAARASSRARSPIPGPACCRSASARRARPAW